MESKEKKVERLKKALASYEHMLNNKEFEFMHDIAKRQIAVIKEELKEVDK